MNLYYSLVRDAFVDGPGLPSLIQSIDGLKRGSKVPLRVQFLDGDQCDIRVAITAASFLRFGLKLPNEYDGDFLALIDTGDWTQPGQAEADPFYVATLNLNTTDLNDAFNTPDADPANDVATLSVMTVFSVREPANDSPRYADRLDITVANSGDTGAEGVPTDDVPGVLTRLDDLEANAVLQNPSTHALTQPTASQFFVNNLTAALVYLYTNDSSTDSADFSGVNVDFSSLHNTPLNASKLTSGTIPDARFPSTLPALNGSALTSLTAANITAAGTLPALNGSALTSLNGSNISSGTVADARLSANLAALSGNTSSTATCSNVALHVKELRVGASGPSIYSGTGSPNSAVSAAIGSAYFNTAGGAGATLWLKESGAGTNTGWVAQ